MSAVGLQIHAQVEATVVPAVAPELPEIVRRYAEGESLQVLKKQCGVKSNKTLYRWMLAGLGDEAYYELITQCLVSRIYDADEALEKAKNKVQVSIARERCRFARMDFERRRPALYGAKPVTVNVAAVSADSALIGTMGELLKTVVAARAPLMLDVDDDTVTIG